MDVCMYVPTRAFKRFQLSVNNSVSITTRSHCLASRVPRLDNEFKRSMAVWGGVVMEYSSSFGLKESRYECFALVQILRSYFRVSSEKSLIE